MSLLNTNEVGDFGDIEGKDSLREREPINIFSPSTGTSLHLSLPFPSHSPSVLPLLSWKKKINQSKKFPLIYFYLFGQDF